MVCLGQFTCWLVVRSVLVCFWMLCGVYYCPYVSGYFWKRIFFFPFSKKYPSTRSVFESFSPVHMKTLKRWKYDNMPYWDDVSWWCMTSYSKTSVFVRPLKRKKPAFSKSALWKAFLKKCFFVDWFHRVRLDSRPNRRKKNPFSNKLGHVWTGPLFFTNFANYFRNLS